MRKVAGKIKKIPLLDLKREYGFLKKDIENQIREIIYTQDWILGGKVREFEEKIANYLRVKYAVGVNSGTDAILISLRSLALKIKGKEFFDKNDEIITPAFTFLATTEAILRAGAKPRFVDIEPFTFTIDPLKIEEVVNSDTVGILPVHLYGFSCNMAKILKIAKKYKLFVVEDCAQAFGAEFRGKKLGSFGDTGAFSFFPSKNLGAWGDGGLIATNDKKIASTCGALRNHGQFKKYDAHLLGYNTRLDTLQAGILLAKLKYVDRFNSLRRRVAKIYDKALSQIKEITLPSFKEQSPVYHLYPIKLSSRKIRDSLLEFLNYHGVEARVYYPKAIYEMEAFKRFKKRGLLQNTKEAILNLLCLPIHPFLKEKEISYVIDKIKEFFRE